MALSFTVVSILAVSPLASSSPQDPASEAESDESGDWRESFIDDVDGMFDASEYLQSLGAFLPIPIPVTEPAVGAGLGLAAVFFQPRTEAGDEGLKRPNLSGVVGLKTENGTGALALFDRRYWGDGSFKSTAFALTSSVYLDFQAPGSSSPFRYNLAADGAQIAGEWMTPVEDLTWELSYSYFEVEARVDTDAALPESLPGRDASRFSSAGAAIRHDSRDSLFSPQDGLLAETSFSVNDEVLGATDDFQRVEQLIINYWPVSDRWVAGLRVQGQAIFGDFPFYAKPYIGLRGVPVMRDQGEIVAAAELELQYAATNRVRLLGFAGAGRAWDSIGGADFDQSTASGGVGIRYRFARKFGLDVGIDFAVSEEDQAIYFQFGNAWMRP